MTRAETMALIGTSLELQPTYGWGWLPAFPWDHLERTSLPPRSRFVLTGVTEFRGELNGGFGPVGDGQDPPLAGLWVCFELREVGVFNLTVGPAWCNLVFRREPVTHATYADVWNRYDRLGCGFVGAPGFTKHAEFINPRTDGNDE